MTEAELPFVYNLDLAHKKGDPNTIRVSHKIESKQTSFLKKRQNKIEFHVSLLEKRGSFYFVTFTGPLYVKFVQTMNIGNDTIQPAKTTFDQKGSKIASVKSTVSESDDLKNSEADIEQIKSLKFKNGAFE